MNSLNGIREPLSSESLSSEYSRVQGQQGEGFGVSRTSRLWRMLIVLSRDCAADGTGVNVDFAL